MYRLITCTVVALLISIAPGMAQNDDQSDAASKAMNPPSGHADKSSGAAQSTSTPPGSMNNLQQDSSNPAAKAATIPPSGSPDTSTGAAQSTSTPPKPGSSPSSQDQ
jgi:hypothetical protein